MSSGRERCGCFFFPRDIPTPLRLNPQECNFGEHVLLDPCPPPRRLGARHAKLLTSSFNAFNQLVAVGLDTPQTSMTFEMRQ